MSAKCGSLGPMICLYGSTCNETTGFCVNCPEGIMNDEVYFRGIHNCGANKTVVVVTYVVASVCAIVASVSAFVSAYGRKHHRMKAVLLVTGSWLALIPFIVLSHYLAGYRYGIATVLLYVAVLCLVNTQVTLINYSLETFLDLILTNGKNQHRTYVFHVTWYIFWMLIKIVFGAVMLAGLGQSDFDLFNEGQMALGVSLLVEVSANSYRNFIVRAQLIEGVQNLEGTVTSSSKQKSVVTEFAEQVKRTRYLGPLYGTIILALGVAFIPLYIVYQGAVPYAMVLWIVIIVTWPMLGLTPLILLRTKLGKQIDRSQRDGNVSLVDDTVTPRPGQDSANATNFVRTSNKEEVRAIVPFGHANADHSEAS